MKNLSIPTETAIVFIAHTIVTMEAESITDQQADDLFDIAYDEAVEHFEQRRIDVAYSNDFAIALSRIYAALSRK